MVGSALQESHFARPDDDAFRQLVESHERAVRLHCYRMLGSLQDAEDQTQETLLRAWRSLESFQGRASLRAWLYRIATNACLDELERRGRRLLPPMLGAPSPAFIPGQGSIPEIAWLDPYPDAWLEVADTSLGPEARYEAKESVELAFIAALQRLAPRQRAALLLRDVLGWSARDLADFLDMSLAAANSALQRARVRMDRSATPNAARLTPEAERSLVERYVRAWEERDLQAFVALLKDDVVLSMPPLAEWFVGRVAVADFFAWATGPSGGGPFRFVQTRANGTLALGVYGPDTTDDAAPDGSARAAGGSSGDKPAPTGGAPGWRGVMLSVLMADRDGVGAITSFMNPGLFGAFDLPFVLPATRDQT
jgi:RNA polymerase sigma-70 factor, ECF subfamily